MISTPTYVTREAVADALDMSPTGYDLAALDRAAAAGTAAVETLTRRVFWPEVATRLFDWPDPGITAPAYRLYLDGEHNELAAAPTAIASGGTTLDVADAIPGPAELGPPYSWLDLDTSSAAAYDSGSTWQSSTGVTGVFAACAVRTRTIGTITAALDAVSTAAAVDGPAAAEVGCGDLLNVGAERMLVTGRTWADAGTVVTLADDTTAAASTFTGTGFAVGERLLVDGERMRVVDVAGTSVHVLRGIDGTQLAAHTAATVYGSRSLIVQRGYGGTTAAAHDDDAACSVQVYPPLVVELALAEALVAKVQQAGAYSRPQGGGDAARPAPSGTIEDVRARCEAAHRRYRQAAI